MRNQESNRNTWTLRAILKAWRAVICEIWRPRSKRAIWQMQIKMKLKAKEPWVALSRSRTKIQAPRCWAQSSTCRQSQKQWQKPIPLSLKLGLTPHSRKPLPQKKRRNKERAICLQPSVRWPREELMTLQGCSHHLVTIELWTCLRSLWVDKGCRSFKNLAKTS